MGDSKDNNDEKKADPKAEEPKVQQLYRPGQPIQKPLPPSEGLNRKPLKVSDFKLRMLVLFIVILILCMLTRMGG